MSQTQSDKFKEVARKLECDESEDRFNENLKRISCDDGNFDNTDGSLEINVSLLVDDADVSANGIPITVTGEIEVLYTQILDD